MTRYILPDFESALDQALLLLERVRTVKHVAVLAEYEPFKQGRQKPTGRWIAEVRS